jgi:hypothetical protein
MSASVRLLRRSFVALSLSLAPLSAGLAACGGADRDEAAADSAVDSAAAATPPADTAPTSLAPSPTESDDAPLAPADVDRWRKGMEAELKAVREAGAKLAAAKSGVDSMTAVGATIESATRDPGAAAAGVSPDRYLKIRSTLSELVGQMVPSEMETGGKMPAAMVEQIKQGREAGLAKQVAELPADLVDAVRPHAEALRRQEMELLAARVQAAGMTRR